jgi:hypothetical protein
MPVKNNYPLRRNGYYYIDGHKYISVTTVLQVLAKPALIRWSAKQAACIALEDPSLSEDGVLAKVWAIKDTAANRGSLVHSFISSMETGKSLPANIQGYANAYENFMKTTNASIISSEQMVYSGKYKYAGTLDAIARIGNKIWILDFKTSKNVYNEYGLQLCAYKQAVEEQGKKIDSMAIVHLKNTGKFSFLEFNDDFKVFLHALELWKWFNKGG